MTLVGRQVSGGRRALGISPWKNDAVPTVSVITVVYNAQSSIGTCIDSVVSQDYPNVEFIVIDAGSKDGTVDILRRYDERIDVWISEPDSGIFDAWNKGLKLSQGKWIAFLGADDEYLQGAIGSYMRMADRCPDAEFLTSRAELVHSSRYAPIFGAAWQWPSCARRLTTINVGTMHKRSLFERFGEFDTTFRSAGDYEFLLRAGKSLNSAFMPEITVKMRSGGASESTANLRERKRARISAGVCSSATAEFDMRVDIARFYLRRLLIALQSILL